MNNSLHVATGTLNLTPLDWEGNKNKILTALATFRQTLNKTVATSETLPAVLCLPELCICGPGCEDMFLAPWLCDRAFDLLLSILPHTHDMIVALGLPVRHEGNVYKGIALVADGQLLGIHCARRLKSDGVHYENRWFSPWTGQEVQTTFHGLDFTLGQSEYVCHGTRIGIADGWEACDLPSKETSLSNVDLLLIPVADAMELDRDAKRRKTLMDFSNNRSCCLVFANLVGNESGCNIYDGGSMILLHGQMIARDKRFSYDDVQVCHCSLTFNAARLLNKTEPIDDETVQSWERSPNTRFEEFSRAVPLGLFDYLRKSRSNGFALSLSGGADSACIATMIRLMIHFGLKHSEFAEKLKYIPIPIPQATISTEASEREIVERLLVTVYQATRNSSDVTRQAAAEVARSVGAKHYECNIDLIVEAYKTMISDAVGRELDWQTDDLALQNIQARTRAPSVWLLANLDNRLLLSTGNRSEVACGYATMDGDTCGGLAPISGIDKAFLRNWLRWMECSGPETFGPCPALRFVNNQQPTAELRPAQSHQTDESDLMPYVVLNMFETALVRDKLSPEAALNQVENLGRSQGYPFTRQEYTAWLEKFLKRWNASQWKRERGAPGFHLDSHDLSPVSWCRFPILSGGLN